MNRTSDRETRLAALEARIQEIAERQELLFADMARMGRTQASIARSVLKLNRELGAQREKYPLS
jgi:hypothetical protein